MNVPHYKELFISKIWNIIKEVDEIMIYFLNYKPNEKPERSYPIAVINTINPEATKEIVANARELRLIAVTDKQENLVKLTSEMRQTISSFSLLKVSFCSNFCNY